MTQYRTYVERPGCIAWSMLLLISLCLAGIPARLVSNAAPGWGWVAYLAALVALLWGFAALAKASGTTHRPICPHCGVVTDPNFPVCRSCGRVKQ